MASEAQEKCVSAGIMLFREQMSYKKATPIIYPINIRGQVNDEDLKITHSELAMATGGAGKPIIAFALTGESGGIVAFDDGKGGCEFTFGLDSELFSQALLREVRATYVKRGPD